MELLPPAEVRDWLLDELARLVERCGFERFVAAPLLLPSDDFFPDHFEPDARGVRAVTRRLLSYAGMGGLAVEVELFEDEPVEHRETHSRVLGWFAGIEGDTCRFGTNVGELHDPPLLVGTMAHEVAHAFRRHRDLVEEDRELEEELTDVTTAYLGFGVLVTNGAFLYRVGVDERGFYKATCVAGGYLAPGALAFLLAAQLVARDRSGERRRIEAALEPMQRDSLRAAFKLLATDAIRERLRLPPPSSWPASDHTAPEALALDDGETGIVPAEEVHAERNQGLPVFRVRRSEAFAWGLAGAGVGLVGFFAVLATGVAVSIYAIYGLILVGGVVGHFLGRKRSVDLCADPDCKAAIPAGAATCPGCGGSVMGEVADPRDRLAAAEELRKRK